MAYDSKNVSQALRTLGTSGLKSSPLRSCHSFMAKAVDEDGALLKYASNPIKRDSDIVFRAIKNTPAAIAYALPADYIKKCVAECQYCVFYVFQWHR